MLETLIAITFTDTPPTGCHEVPHIEHRGITPMSLVCVCVFVLVLRISYAGDADSYHFH